ncbi:MAG: hypothetical protein FJ083_01705 [Cyanobacteria bacterium K_Offshore_surface_m2_239]|nr:hypothetical protein [Cyanobacteria bacterium K_Offshore_surface_m2_239]
MNGWIRSLLRRPLAQGVILAGAVAGSLAIPEAAKALVYIPGQGYASSLVTVIQCGAIGPYAVPPCPNVNFKRRAKKVYVFQDPPGSGLTSFTTSFTYDRSLMTFDPQATSLLCELRSASATSFCPDTPAGVGTQALGTIDDFDVDQTGLTIQDDPLNSSVSIGFTSPTPILFTGERNFLALAFDLQVPLEAGASIAYSTTPLSDASFSLTNFNCDVDCTSSNPAVAFKLNPVPAPLAVGGLPVMVRVSRRLRRRIRLATIG